MGPFGAGIRWHAGRQEKKTVFSQRAQGTQRKHQGNFLLFLCLFVPLCGYPFAFPSRSSWFNIVLFACSAVFVRGNVFSWRRALRHGDLEIFANLLDQEFVQFPVSRHCRGLSRRSVDNHRVAATLPQVFTAMMSQMLEEIPTFHAVT